MPTIPNTYTQTDTDEIIARALRGFSRADEARAIRADRAAYRMWRRESAILNRRTFAADIDGRWGVEIDRRRTFAPGAEGAHNPKDSKGMERCARRRAYCLSFAGERLELLAYVAEAHTPGRRFSQMLAQADDLFAAAARQERRARAAAATVLRDYSDAVAAREARIGGGYADQG